ncbi:MAG: hypothetical protein U9O94_01335 [Nanoarchaeota archaeon]|nr:hypothetical protein [Nanoarchaeota archaeon]
MDNNAIDISNINSRDKILDFEELLAKSPDAKTGDALDQVCPLKHRYADNVYAREIFMPKDHVITSKIHKTCHFYVILEGEVIVATEDGTVRLKAPYVGITPAGTKRAIHIIEDCRWITFHVTEHTDLKKIEDQIIAKSFDELIDSTKETKLIKEV